MVGRFVLEVVVGLGVMRSGSMLVGSDARFGVV